MAHDGRDIIHLLSVFIALEGSGVEECGGEGRRGEVGLGNERFGGAGFGDGCRRMQQCEARSHWERGKKTLMHVHQPYAGS